METSTEAAVWNYGGSVPTPRAGGWAGGAAVEGSKTVAEMFLHIHGTRRFLISEDAPEFAGEPLRRGGARHAT